MNTLLIDAVKTLISSDAEYTFETWSLNKELADYLATRSEHIIVVTNAFGDKYKKVRELLSAYDFDTFTLENRPPKNDSAYFDHLLVYYGRDPEQCFYLDHKPENLAAAAELGIKGELFLDTKQGIEVLKALQQLYCTMILIPSQNERYNQIITHKGYTQADYDRANSLDFQYVTNEDNFKGKDAELYKVLFLHDNDALGHELDFMAGNLMKQNLLVEDEYYANVVSIAKQHNSPLRIHESLEALGMAPGRIAMRTSRYPLQMKYNPDSFENAEIYKTKMMQDTFDVALSNLRNTLGKYSLFQIEEITKYKEKLVGNFNNG